MKPYLTQRGYTLLFAVLFSAVVLIVSISILTISRKELVLSATARDSQEAFYAADAGAECAIYWDYNDDPTTHLKNFSYGTNPASNQSITCNNVAATYSPTRTMLTGVNYLETYAFYYTVQPAPGGTCAYVTIRKTYSDNDNDGSVDKTVTRIDSRGRTSTDCSPTASYPPQTVERGIKVTY